MAPPYRDGAPALRRIVHFALIAIFIQLALGATLRHHGAGLAIPDFPLAYGKVVPPLTHDGIQTAMIDWADDPFTFKSSEHGWYSPFQVAIHWTHRLFAVIAFIIVGLMVDKVRRGAKSIGKLRAPATAVGVMLLLQIALGASIIWTGRHPEVATAHQTLGAILLATTALIAFRLRAMDCAMHPDAMHSGAMGKRVRELARDEQPSSHDTGTTTGPSLAPFVQGARA